MNTYLELVGESGLFLQPLPRLRDLHFCLSLETGVSQGLHVGAGALT